MTAMVHHLSNMTQCHFLFTLITYYAIVTSFALVFADSWFTCCAQARNQGSRSGGSPPRKVFTLLEKCVRHSLKMLDMVQKLSAPLGKLFAPPGVPIWLRAWLHDGLLHCFCISAESHETINHIVGCTPAKVNAVSLFAEMWFKVRNVLFFQYRHMTRHFLTGFT